MCSIRTLSHAIFACLFFVSLTSGLRAQGTNSSPWPSYPPVGIGTQLDGGPQNALHIHYDPAHSTLPAILRLSQGGWDTDIYYGALALMTQDSSSAYYAKWSNLAAENDLILHEQRGDLILANYNEWGGAIRMSTTPVPTTIPAGTPFNDLERMTIDQNGNVGIDLLPGLGGLCAPLDQIQIGGGVLYSGNPAAGPGLAIYGGNRFENMLRPVGMGGGLFPGDWRYIAFNEWVDHTDTSSNRFKRFQPMSSSRFAFAASNGGLLDLNCYPYDSARGLNDFTKGTTMELTGSGGLALWFMDTNANPYHHLFDILLPGDTAGGIRNTNGLSYFHTPLCITSDHGGVPQINFTNLSGLYPDIGDGLTWMLVVNGPELAKEIYVLDSTWADYVFDPNYKLPPLAEVENFTKENHHLPDIPSAKQMAKSGVPVGRTEEALTKQMEEMMLYIEQLNHKIEGLETEVKELKNGKEK